jgi:hypothetical protein
MRPRFRLEVPSPPGDVHARLQAQLACRGCPCQADVVGHHVEVKIRADLRHTWSPRLSLEIEPHEDGTLLHGLYGPSPEVWTSFVAAYAILGLSAVFVGFLGLAQLAVGEPPWGLWVAGGCLAGWILPYAGARVGQRLAAEQMELLRCFLEEMLSLEHPRSDSPLCPSEAEAERIGRPLPVVQPAAQPAVEEPASPTG